MRELFLDAYKLRMSYNLYLFLFICGK